MTRDAAVLGVPTLTAFADRPASVNNFFFFNDTPPPEIYTPLYTLSLHDALPIWQHGVAAAVTKDVEVGVDACFGDRSEEHTSELQSHSGISYAVFCLKKKKN